MSLLLDVPGTEMLLRYRDPSSMIVAYDSSEVGGALQALEAARQKGFHLAGWLAYELGYALEERFAPLFRKRDGLPLLCFGAFSAPVAVDPGDLIAETRAYAGPLRHVWDENTYRARFSRAKDYIAAGDIYQANLSFRSHFAFKGDALGLYLALRERARARHAAYVEWDGYRILSLSPELFFRISAEGRITARPMKGTIARAGDGPADIAARQSLAASEKNRAENLMIVDLLRNDIGRLAKIGSVEVPELFAVETYPTLHTMVSTVEATLNAGTSIGEILRAVFPCGSVTGAPKMRAMEIIRELEDDARGVYCGAIGHFAPDGSAAFNVAIRTITIEDGRGTLGIGSAVVADSDAGAEYAECLLKARFLTDARTPIGLIETLRWDGKFIRLDRHLARMASSAREFDLPFSADAARSALQQSVANANGALRVRLALDECGEFSCTATPLGPAPGCWTYALSPRRIDSRDPLLRHKTTWRELYEGERERAARLYGADEAVFLNERGELTESSRANIFLRKGARLLTPHSSSGLLEGVLRGAMIEEGRCSEAVLTASDLETAEEIFLGNSLRGLIRARPVAIV